MTSPVTGFPFLLRVKGREAWQVLADLHDRGTKITNSSRLSTEMKQRVYFERKVGAKLYLDLFKAGNLCRVLLRCLQMRGQLSSRRTYMIAYLRTSPRQHVGHYICVLQSTGLRGRRSNLIGRKWFAYLLTIPNENQSVQYVLIVVLRGQFW